MSEEKYISMSVSRDSDEGALDGNMVLDFCKVSNGCFGSPTPLADADHSQSSENHCVTRPTTTNSSTRPHGKNDLSEALMGDEAFQHISDQAMLGLPSTKGLLSRLRQLNLREKLEVTVWNQRFWPVLPLVVKAEMNAPLTVVEEITTWIVLISWLQVVVLGSALSVIVGGVALFLSLTILHFWYGFTRYHSLEGDWYDDLMFGKALDENFELIRDICSYQCHGDGERRKQIGAIVFTAPFTLVNHLCFLPVFILSQIYQMADGGDGGASNSDTQSPTVPLMVGVFVANILVTTTWLFGGPILQTLSVVTFLVNQRLYNALLFRRSFEGFITSFVLGNFCIGEPSTSMESTVQEENVEDDGTREVVNDSNELKKKRSWTAKVKNTARWITEKTKARLAARKKNRINRTNSKQASLQRSSGGGNGEEDDIEMGRLPDAIIIKRSDSLFDGLEDDHVPTGDRGITSEIAFVPLVDDVPATSASDVSSPYTLLPSKRDTPSIRNTFPNRAVGMSNGSRSATTNNNTVREDQSLEELPFDVIQKGKQDKSRTVRIQVISSNSPDAVENLKSTDMTAKEEPAKNGSGNQYVESSPISPTLVDQQQQQQQDSTKSKVTKKFFGPKVNVTVTTGEQEKEPVDESVEIADVINVESYLRKVVKEEKLQRRSRSLSFNNKRRVGVDVEHHGKDDFASPSMNVKSIRDSVEISDNVILKGHKSKGRDMKMPILGRVFKRSGGSELGENKRAIRGVLSTHEAKEPRDGGASAEFQKKKEPTTGDGNQSSTKRAMDTIGGILQSSDSVSGATKNSSKSKSKNTSSDDSVVMWSDNQSMSTDSASLDDDDNASMQVTDAMDFLGEMLCLTGPKRHKTPLILNNDGNSVSGSTLDSRDLPATDNLSGDGSREGEPEDEDIIESTLNESKTPLLQTESKPKKNGIKKFFPRLNKPIKVEKLDEKSKNDPELVKKWIVDQTKTLRTRSKVLSSVWNRAIKLGQKKEANKIEVDEANANLLHEKELEAITSENDELSLPPVKPVATKQSFHVVFDAKTLEQEELKRNQQEVAKKQELAKKEDEAAAAAKETPGDSFYDQLMLIWFNDYVKATPKETPELQPELNALADDISASDGSTLSSMASLMSQVPPKNLIEFVEQKIEEEILLSRFCIGDSVYSGMQCDAGLGYLTDKESSGFLADLCGIKA